MQTIRIKAAGTKELLTGAVGMITAAEAVKFTVQNGESAAKDTTLEIGDEHGALAEADILLVAR